MQNFFQKARERNTHIYINDPGTDPDSIWQMIAGLTELTKYPDRNCMFVICDEYNYKSVIDIVEKLDPIQFLVSLFIQDTSQLSHDDKIRTALVAMGKSDLHTSHFDGHPEIKELYSFTLQSIYNIYMDNIDLEYGISKINHLIEKYIEVYTQYKNENKGKKISHMWISDYQCDEGFPGSDNSDDAVRNHYMKEYMKIVLDETYRPNAYRSTDSFLILSDIAEELNIEESRWDVLIGNYNFNPTSTKEGRGGRNYYLGNFRSDFSLKFPYFIEYIQTDPAILDYAFVLNLGPQDTLAELAKIEATPLILDFEGKRPIFGYPTYLNSNSWAKSWNGSVSLGSSRKIVHEAALGKWQGVYASFTSNEGEYTPRHRSNIGNTPMSVLPVYGQFITKSLPYLFIENLNSMMRTNTMHEKWSGHPSRHSDMGPMAIVAGYLKFYEEFYISVPVAGRLDDEGREYNGWIVQPSSYKSVIMAYNELIGNESTVSTPHSFTTSLISDEGILKWIDHDWKDTPWFNNELSPSLLSDSKFQILQALHLEFCSSVTRYLLDVARILSFDQ